jgi:hypothetical protein
MTSLQSQIAYTPLAADGAIHQWLACGPVTSPIPKLEKSVSPDGSPFGEHGRWALNYWAWDDRVRAMKLRVYRQLPEFTWTPPGERPVLGASAIDGQTWRYAAAEEDQVIDFSRFNFTPTRMQAWVFALLHVEQPIRVRTEVLTIGPARVFLNGALHTNYDESFSYVALQYIPVELDLQSGDNELYLQGEMLAFREARLALGLRFLDSPAINAGIPIGSIDPVRWQQAEQGLEHLLVKQFAFPTLPGYVTLSESAERSFAFNAEVKVAVPTNVSKAVSELELPKGVTQYYLSPGESAELPITSDVTPALSSLPGENTLILKFSPSDGIPLSVEREIWAGHNQFSQQPYGDYESRRQEALAHLAAMPFDVPAGLAAVEAGKADMVSSDAIGLSCHFLENRYDCADFYAIGLLALLYRHNERSTPIIAPDDQQRIENALRGFKFWLDEPGLDAMCYFTENHQVLFHVSSYLCGQLWPDAEFINSGRTGREQMSLAAPRIEAWILTRLRGSFSEWDSNAYMALDAFAMLALVEFAEDERLRDMATTLLHKLFFLLACQSFRGVHGSTHGRCYVAGLKSARVENTSSLQRIAWGMGIFNGETRATGLLAIARNYAVPEVLQKIGTDVDSVVVTRARSKAAFKAEYDMRDDDWDVRTLTYRTPEVMLSAALDYLPGEFGIQEHLWQATLGPEQVVFTTYPGNSQEHGNARPNFWAGSARLPRVGMVDRTVICLYRFEPNVGLGFSHAYFPVPMFDETRIKGQWAFARTGDGYVALWGDGDLVLTEHGRHAGQELRSSGAGQVWICHIGRAADDGDFASFCKRLLQTTPEKNGLGVQWTTPEGLTLAFAWEGVLTVNGAAEDWNFPHYDNTYTHTPMDSGTMTIRYQDQILTLDLANGRVEQA